MNWDRVERLIGTDNLARLGAKHVGIIGLGSGGGFVALSLAMSGVGHFVLVDDDVVEPGNVVRHVADNRYLGHPKVEAVADLIRRRHPKAQVETRFGRIEQHSDALDGLDILVVGVDGENAKYLINQMCLKRGLTAVYAGVYERGEGGDVVVVRPYNGPCYACWAAELREGLGADENHDSSELDYGMIGPEGTLEAEPGLWLHVVRVASVQADLALNELLQGTDVYRAMPANTVILANTALEIVSGQISPPYTSVWVDIARDPNCLVCGNALHNQLAGEESERSVSLDELTNAAGIALQDEAGE